MSEQDGSGPDPELHCPFETRIPDPGQRDDGLEASSAPRIMATSDAPGVTRRRQPIPSGIPMRTHDDGGGPGPITPVQAMHVSETHQQMPSPSQHDIQLIIDRLAATELQNHQLQLRLAQTVHAMDQLRQFGSTSPSVSMPSQSAHVHLGPPVPQEAFGASALHRQPLIDMTQYHSPIQAASSAQMSLPIQMGPHILELESQQRWMMLQRMTLQTESSNHHPSTISAGVFPQEDSNGMRSSGIASSGGRFSVSMLESTPEHKHKEFVTLMRHYRNAQCSGQRRTLPLIACKS
jgi:hypothetical protein